jgi:alkylated DNA repair dioxygenase AlkB
MTAQAELFEIDRSNLPEGMRYRDGVLSETQERSLAHYIGQLPLRPFEFAGGFKGNRRVLSFGWRYDYTLQKLTEAAPVPAELYEIRETVAAWTGHPPGDLKQVLVTAYPPGAGIGWHRDKAMFGDVIGISLLAPCVFRLRRKAGERWERRSFEAQPRSAYLMSGPSRSVWEHSIPPLDKLRYSITFRTLAG